MKNKALIITYADLEKSNAVFKDKKIVLVGGCFDLIHYGHLKFLEAAKEQGDFLIVALESDEFIKKHKRENDESGADMSHDKIQKSGFDIILVFAVIYNQKIRRQRHYLPRDKKKQRVGSRDHGKHS